MLAALELGPDDVLLDVGCGGGVFLRRALETGCRAAGVDHSPDMVRLARAKNEAAVRSGRLRVEEGRAEELPFAAGEFTAVSCLVAFMFFPDPVRVLAELLRVLDPERGRVAVYTSAPELLGTPALPDPIATRCRLYDDEELRRLPPAAGFRESRVERPGDGGAQLLVARP